MMKTTVTGRHVEITPALRAHVEERMDHLARYSGRPTEASVVLTVEKYRHQAEVTLNVDGVLIQAKEETSEMYASIDQTVAKIERQLKKYKDRQHVRRQRHPLTELNGEAVEPSTTGATLVRERPTLDAMTPEQAAAALSDGGSSLLVFRREGTDEVNVVYRKADGSVVWIDPAP
jgi:putative sigma-54 modulation protein